MSRPPVEHREVPIIGAGPAGTAAAAKFSELGHDVLVLDRRAVVGNPAQCGECIPNWGEVVGTFRDLDDHDWLASYFEWPDRIISQRLDHMRVVLPSGKTFGFELDCISSPRLQFDGLLAERAVAAGAEVRMEVALTKVLRDNGISIGSSTSPRQGGSLRSRDRRHGCAGSCRTIEAWEEPSPTTR